MSDIMPTIADLDINPDAAAMLLPHVDSFVKWELLRFLHDNPDRAATIEELARYTGRDETELKPATRSLAKAGLFRQIDGGGDYAVALTPDEPLRQMIAHLVQSFMADRLVRLAISAHILRAQRRAAMRR